LTRWLRRIAFQTAATLAAGLAACTTTSPSAPQADLALTPAEWRDDVAAFARELPNRHAAPFHAISQARFDAEIKALEDRLDRLNGDEAFVGLRHIARLVGDGHTNVALPPNRPTLPLQIMRFAGEDRVVKVGAGYDQALGARIVAIGGVPVDDVRRRLLTLTPYDETDALREWQADALMSESLVLHGLDITATRDAAVLTLQPDHGAAFDIAVRAVPAGDAVFPPTLAQPLALARQNPDKGFWCVWLDAQHTVYCDWRNYVGLRPASRQLYQLIEAHKPDKVVIDLRANGGGDYTVGLANVVRPLASNADVNRRGHLFVLIGVATFSAAMSNASHFRAQTNAILVGEPIGERPNSWQENRQFVLPRSHLAVSYSTRFYSFAAVGGENIIRPDQTIETSWADYAAGRDPVLDWVLAYRQPAAP
jgi:hypothetical protein